MNSRQHTEQDYNFLKASTRRLVSLAGGVESAAQVTRVNKTAISDYQKPQSPAAFMPIDVVADLEADAGTPFITEALAKLSGYYMVPAPLPGVPISLAQHLAIIGKQMGDVFQHAGLAVLDGPATPEENQRILDEINEAVRVLLQARGALEQEIEQAA